MIASISIDSANEGQSELVKNLLLHMNSFLLPGNKQIRLHQELSDRQDRIQL